MPLARAQEEVFEGIDGIHFLMRDVQAKTKEGEVPCLITLEALTDRGTAHDPPLTAGAIFEADRDAIEQTASDKWDRGELDDKGVVRLTAAEFPAASPLAERTSSRKARTSVRALRDRLGSPG